jgi:hypothetical protein
MFSIFLDQVAEATTAQGSNCVRCGTYVRLPPSEHFKTVCGPNCWAPVDAGTLKSLPREFKSR